jgi:tetratricopeptide (TPR) repeat protein
VLRRVRILLHGLGLAASAVVRELFLLIGLYKVPVAFYGILLAIWPSKRVGLMRGLAAVYERVGKLEKAERYLVAVVELEPQDPISHWDLGVVHEKQGERDRAAERFAKALSLGADLSIEFRDELRNRVNRLRARQ